MRSLCVLLSVLIASSAQAGEQPPLVGLPGLAPLPSANTRTIEVDVTSEVQTVQQVKASSAARAAMLELDIGEGVDPGLARRIGHELVQELTKLPMLQQVVSPAEASASLPLEAQAQLSGCNTPSCLIEVGAMLDVAFVISPRLTLEQGGFRLVLGMMDLEAEKRWTRERAGLSTEAEVKESLPGLAASLWTKEEAVAIVASTMAPVEVALPTRISSNGAWKRWGSLGVSLGGLALVGASNLMMNNAQEAYEPATATGEDYDALVSAQSEARMVWGGGLVLASAGAAGFVLLAP